MLSEHLSEGPVEQVSTAVVGRYLAPARGVHHEGEFSLAIAREFLGNVDGEVVFLYGVEDLDLLSVGGDDESRVSYFTAHFPVERGAVEHKLEHLPVFLDYGPVLQQQGALRADGVVSGELDILAGMVYRPVAEAVGCGVAGPVLLFLELDLEAFEVYRAAVLPGDQFSEVDWEAVGVVELERVSSGDDLALSGSRDALVHQLDAPVEGAQECELLFADDILYEFLLLGDLRIGLSHIIHELLHEAAEERFAQPEEGVSVADGAAEDSPDDIACLDIGRQLPVGDAEADSPDVVCDDPHRYVGLCVLAVAVAGNLPDLGEQAAEDVGIVVAVLALEHAAEALESHSGVDVVCREALKVAVGHPLVLHEHEVPDLYHVRVGLVDQVASAQACGGFLLRGADVYVDLGARAARAGVSHLPEVVVLVAEQDVVLRHVFEPGFPGFMVHRGAVIFAALEHGGVEQLRVDLVDFGKELPRPVYRLFLEIVPEAPVAEHLEHGVVVGVVPDFFEVVVLAAHSQTFLRICRSRVRGLGVAQEDVLELVHSGVGEHQRRVILDHHRSGRHDGVSLGCEEIQKFLSYFLRSHNTAKYQTIYKNTTFF